MPASSANRTTVEGSVVPTRTISPGDFERELSAQLAAAEPGRRKALRRRRIGGRARVRYAGLLGIAALLVVGISGVFAVHDEGFQLEGNQDSNDLSTGLASPNDALTSPFDGQYDWFDSSPTSGGTDGIFKLDGTGEAVNNTPLPGDFLAAGFAKDFRTKVTNKGTVFDTSDGTTFTGGSKDTLDVNAWSCVGANNVTDKGDITNAYATMQVVGGHRLVYFALEKNAVQGDNNVGFWFLQNPASCPPDSTGNGTHFTGSHADGDVFVVSEFTNGGGISSIKAYVWSGGALTGPVYSGVDCLDTPTGNDPICATTNRVAITPAWPHASKDNGLTGSIPTAAFFEGGVDLDAPDFGFANQCFANFLANTRSSQSTTATLYDYALGELSTCGDVTVRKVTVPANSGSDSFSYTTTGGAPLASFSLDTNPGTATPSEKFFGSVPPGSYTVDEGSTTGWNPYDLTCTKNGSPFSGGDTTNTSTGVASFHVDFGDHIICTYTNVQPLAKISISPDATNQVGEPHTFTVDVQQDASGTGSSYGPVADGTKPTVTLTDSDGASHTGVTDNCATTGTTSGTCTVVFTSNSAGKVTGHATASVTVGSVTLNVATDGISPNSDDAVKTYVDAQITIASSATNKVGEAHTFTVTVEKDLGDGSGFVAAAGETVATSLEAGSVGSISGGTCTTTVTDGSGQCTVIVDSDDTGTATVNASTTVTIDSVDIDVATDGYGAHDISNVKTWVDAQITIASSATNKVGEAHTFTVTVEKDLGDGSGFVAAAGETVATSLEAGSVGSISGGTCTTTVTDGSGQCTVIVDSDDTGTATVNASTTVTIDSVDIDVATDGYGAHDISNVKTWVDAQITIASSATNKVGEAHTFTVTVEKDLGDGSGFVAAAGETVATSLEAGSVGSISGGTCTTTVTDGSGQCTVIVDSDDTGTATVNASTTVTIDSVDIDVATDGYGAHDISNVKTWVDAQITIASSATNKVGEAHTFTVTVEKDLGDGSGFVAAAGETVATSLEAGSVGSISGGTCTTTVTDGSGQCTVIVDSDDTGTATVNASTTVTIDSVDIDVATDGYGAHDISNVKTWVDLRISIGTSDTNQVNDSHTFTVTVEADYGDGNDFVPVSGANVLGSSTGVGSITGGSCDNSSGDTNASGQCTIIVDSAVTGTTTVNAATMVNVGGVSISVATNGSNGPGATVSNVKTWVDARISIETDGTNKVGDAHTFTVTVQKDIGDGNGFGPAQGVNVDASSTGAGSITGGTCDNTGGDTDSSGQCTIVVNSDDTGVATVDASATVDVSGVMIDVATDGYGATTVENTKTWVDAQITIHTSGTNQVGEAHTFTVVVEADYGDGAGFIPVEGVDVLASETGVGTITGGTCDNSGGDTDSNGQCTIIVNSNAAGQGEVNATATVDVSGVMIDVDTDGYGAHDISNIKTWVSADISIQTNGTNKVGDPHTFTVTVRADFGDGNGLVPVAGANVLGSEDGVGSITGGTCDNSGGDTNASGQCTIIVSSDATGQSTVDASTTIDVNGVPVDLATDGNGANIVENTKTWVDARISIETDGTNKVGDPHTFVVTVEADYGDGAGFVPVAGVNVLGSEDGVGSITGGTCDNSGGDTNASGQCTIVVNSSATGESTVDASATVDVAGVMIDVATDGYGSNTVENTKTWVDARITIQTSGTNAITEPHTFVVTVEADYGDGAGFVAVEGVDVLASETGVGSITGGTCDNTGGDTDSAGQCTIIVSSNAAGQSEVNATATVDVSGIDIDVDTDGYGAHDISNIKTWVDGSLTWLKHDNNGQLLGGATFEVCRTHDRFGADIPDECVTVADDVDNVDDTTGDWDGTPGEFKLGNLLLGRYTIEETVAPVPYTLDPFVETIELTLADPDKSATHIWVNTPAGEGCTPGFWKNHAKVWDQLTDPTVAAMPAGYQFITTTSFNAYFGLTPAQTGVPNSFTMLDAASATGGGEGKLMRHGVSALLNVAALGGAYPLPAGITDFVGLYDALKTAFATGVYEPLATQIAANNDLDHQNCPS